MKVCFVCKKGGKILDFNDESFKKCCDYVRIRKLRRFKYGELELTAESKVNNGYHLECYKRIISLKRKYIDDHADTGEKTMAITLIILSTLLSSSLSFPLVKTWTLNEISTALELQTHPDLRSHLENALNTIMFAMFTESEQDVLAVLQSPSGQREWTRVELIKAAHNSSTNPNYKPFIKNALQYLKNIEHKDVYDDDMIEVTIPAMDISVWTPQDVDEAKLDPNLPADVWDLLKKVDKSLKSAMEAGTPKDKVTATLVTPVGIVPSNGEKREIISSKKAETKSE